MSRQRNAKVGDYGMIFKGSRLIGDAKWKEMYPQGQFGRIISIREGCNCCNKIRTVTVRVYAKHKDGKKYRVLRWHKTLAAKDFQLL